MSVGLTGLAMGLIAGIDSYEAVLFLFWVQGCGFGGIDTFANVVLPEIWGDRVQPWMQALHSFFGVGAVLGPALVGGFGFSTAFIILAIISVIPLVAMVIEYFLRVHAAGPMTVAEAAKATEETDLMDGTEVWGDNAPTLWTECNCAAGDVERVDVAEVPKVPAAEPPDVPRKVPLLPRCLLVLFFFIYVGAECGYAGWVSSFALMSGVTASQSEAAFVASIFWAALTVGRVVAIPQALFISTTGMIRLQLTLSVLGAILTCTINQQSYPALCIASAVFGYALSSIFPLAMTMAMDYSLCMDGPTTSMFVIGATFGEGAIPVAIGLAMNAGGPMALSYSVITSVGILVALYWTVHVLLLRETRHDNVEIVKK